MFPQSKEGKSPLHMAAIHGRFTRSQILIQNGMHWGPLCSSCRALTQNPPFLLPYLPLRTGIWSSAFPSQASSGDSAWRGMLSSFSTVARECSLAEACRGCVCVLVSGSEIDCADKFGNTPLHVAARYGHELLISTLMTNGADTAR